MKAALLAAAISYLLGSVPFGYLLVRVFRKQDIRATGSGNIGATNVARSSPGLGVLTLLLDGLKGLGSVLLARHFFLPAHPNLPALAAFFAVAGHIFPVWLNFRGGKGVATGLGSFVVLVPKAVLVAIGIFAALVAAFRFISLGSIIAVAALPFLAYLLDGWRYPVPLFFLSASSLLIIFKHEANLRRLAAGTEPYFGARK